MKTTVFLIRHGEIDNPKNIMYGRNIDLELSESGKKQIHSLARRFKEHKIKIEKIYTSPLKRALESARILTSELGLKNPIVEQKLTDINIPFLAGKSMEERKKIHSSGMDEYSDIYVKLGNESRNHVINRVKNAFEKIFSENKGRVIAIVSHGDPLQFLLYALFHPGEKIPSMNVLAKQNYPPKGSAVQLVIDDRMKILNRKEI